MKKYRVYAIVWNSKKEKIEHVFLGAFCKYIDASRFRDVYERIHSARCFID